MGIVLATKTLEAIRNKINEDQGSSFRVWQGRVLPHIGDAYLAKREDGMRSHLGASGIGKECARAIWYDFHWVGKGNNHLTEDELESMARMQRLWNRGHLEEGRFIALLLMIGARVVQQDADGKQIRFLDYHGHYAGSMDGEVVNLPDLDRGHRALVEFKTYNDKRFAELTKNGVENSDWTYYVQMQQYMGKRGLDIALFCAVNKNDETLHMELVAFDKVTYEQFRDRAIKIIMLDTPPLKLRSASPGYFKCKICDFTSVCLLGSEPAVNCRTCGALEPIAETDADGKGVWYCRYHKRNISTADQKVGCPHYKKNGAL